jgi:hypothetical protein
MLKWEDQMIIKFLVGQGHSIRQTAKLSGHARNCVFRSKVNTISLEGEHYFARR